MISELETKSRDFKRLLNELTIYEKLDSEQSAILRASYEPQEAYRVSFVKEGQIYQATFKNGLMDRLQPNNEQLTSVINEPSGYYSLAHDDSVHLLSVDNYLTELKEKVSLQFLKPNPTDIHSYEIQLNEILQNEDTSTIHKQLENLSVQTQKSVDYHDEFIQNLFHYTEKMDSLKNEPDLLNDSVYNDIYLHVHELDHMAKTTSIQLQQAIDLNEMIQSTSQFYFEKLKSENLLESYYANDNQFNGNTDNENIVIYSSGEYPFKNNFNYEFEQIRFSGTKSEVIELMIKNQVSNPKQIIDLHLNNASKINDYMKYHSNLNNQLNSIKVLKNIESQNIYKAMDVLNKELIKNVENTPTIKSGPGIGIQDVHDYLKPFKDVKDNLNVFSMAAASIGYKAHVREYWQNKAFLTLSENIRASDGQSINLVELNSKVERISKVNHLKDDRAELNISIKKFEKITEQVKNQPNLFKGNESVQKDASSFLNSRLQTILNQNKSFVKEHVQNKSVELERN